MSDVKPVPDGFSTVSVYLVVPRATEAMAFYEKAFGATPGLRMTGPDGDATLHAELQIGDSTIMLTDENPDWNQRSPETLGGSAASLHMYVPDADAAFERAVAAGCEVEYPIDDTFWGDRYGKVRDPYGYTWGIATHKEDLSEDELGRRQSEFFEAMAEGAAASEG